MQTIHLIVFTAIWTAVWVAPLPKLPPRAELAAGLIPFAAFGLRVFAGFFVDVPAEDPVKAAVGPLLTWINGQAGILPYQTCLDGTVALGLLWLASAFDIPRQSRIATCWIMPTVAILSLLSLAVAGEPLEQLLGRRLPPPLLGCAAGAAVAGVITFTPGPLDPAQRQRAALVAAITVPAAVTAAAALLWLAGELPPSHAGQITSVISLGTGLAAGGSGWFSSRLTRPRSRFLFAMVVGVVAGAIVKICSR